ncbi:hypothetical protein IE81DRAFT_77468 [Ceraceosorus guamensis]|uniref:Dickkopf N-terminal cysteine-rich domain-containing protein n=1 Tax=Ceraceosorus guamensis TaxID=1522189 RepID=A0A316W1D2_9BASI|nr:hypothetical protein IE81DRAFT_77468 [Ceraceosorus guamensis]PWN43532.1 hypothetical protein IE81DRAFT_77468 [Ceraceosorus guamensis]
MRVTLLALLPLAMVIASSSKVNALNMGDLTQEDMEILDARNHWFERDLYAERRSVPSGPTSTSVSVVPRPTGTSAPGTGCTKSADCGTGNCERGVCKPVVSTGAQCYKNANCASFNCTNGKCVPVKGQGVKGETCNASDQCTAGSFCEYSKCNVKVASGGVCYKDVGCTSGNCVNKTCIEPASVSRGGRCTKTLQCKTNSYCGTNNRCAAKANKGGACYKTEGCAAGLTCRKKKCRA